MGTGGLQMSKKHPRKADDRSVDSDTRDWTRSFPQGAGAESDDWMVAVLDDLHAYATTHDLDEIAENLADTRKLVLAHLSGTRH